MYFHVGLRALSLTVYVIKTCVKIHKGCVKLQDGYKGTLQSCIFCSRQMCFIRHTHQTSIRQCLCNIDLLQARKQSEQVSIAINTNPKAQKEQIGRM
jgi:hypothetical protein